jgi:alcohol dehydrogenase YqhD (iron-dependent ADH family)
MIRGFFKYFSFLLFFLFGATGIVPALSQTPGRYPAEKSAVLVQDIPESSEQVHAVITRLPAAGSERRTNSLLASENKVPEESLSSKKGSPKYTSLAAAFAFVFLPSLNIARGVFGTYPDLTVNLSNKVYLLIRVFRI